MTSRSRILWIAIAGVVLVVAALLLQPTVKEALEPELIGARVGIEVEGGGIAEVGVVRIAAGAPFTLRAVLVAQTRDGAPVYYSEAPALRIAGADVPREQLRIWDRGGDVRVRWLTVEGSRPWVPLEGGLESFEIRPLLRSHWPLAWSVPGELEPAFDDAMVTEGELPELPFGTQRYRVQIELYAEETHTVPLRTIASPGVDELRSDPTTFPTVIASLADGRAAASRVFGLSQLEPAGEPAPELLGRLDELARLHLAFTRVTLLRDQIHAAGLRSDQIRWRQVDLAGDERWGREVVPGDLLRLGDRVVVLHEEGASGTAGILDPADLAFDFVRGAAVRPLGEVFAGGTTTVDHAPLFPARP